MTYQIKLVDTNGRAYATQVGQTNTRKSHSDEEKEFESEELETLLQVPETVQHPDRLRIFR